jgi:YbbR domain-containing protein
MPFQDSEEIQYKPPRVPSAAERWLQRIFVEDFNLKLLSLGITLVLWFAVTGQRQPLSKRFAGVPLGFVHADKVEIANDPPRTIDVTLTGNSDILAKINPQDLLANVMVTDQAMGDRVVRLSRERVKLDLPSGVQIDGFQPATVSVRLEPRVDREVKVEVMFEGKVADGYEVSGVTASPAKVQVHGPAGHVTNIDKAPTESISLAGRKASFDVNQAAINIPDQKIDVSVGAVHVHVEISERSVQKALNANEITSPKIEADVVKTGSRIPARFPATPK